MADATAAMGNNHQTPTALGPQLEDPPKLATARAVTAVAVAVAVVAAAKAHHTTLAKELAAATIAGAEATRTATPPATHVAATMPATGLRRFVAKMLLKQATATASPPTPLDFAIYSSLRNSSLS
jgi:DNA-binding LacI/PurR family transcriptional regulator